MRIHAVLIEEVDVIGSETPERSFNLRANGFWTAIRPIARVFMTELSSDAASRLIGFLHDRSARNGAGLIHAFAVNDAAFH